MQPVAIALAAMLFSMANGGVARAGAIASACPAGTTCFSGAASAFVGIGDLNSGDEADFSDAGAAVATTGGTSPFGGISAGGTAAADLTTGILKAFATSSDPDGEVLSDATFQDTLKATANGTMTFAINLSGAFSRDTSFSGSAAAGRLGFTFATNSNAFDFSSGRENGPVFNSIIFLPWTSTSTGCSSFGVPGGASTCDLSVTFPVLVGDTFSFRLTLEADAINGTADMAHSLGLDVGGVPFESDSGIFRAAAVPLSEPATPALLLSGLAILWFARHRRAF
jgi:hypothetical protein